MQIACWKAWIRWIGQNPLRRFSATGLANQKGQAFDLTSLIQMRKLKSSQRGRDTIFGATFYGSCT